MGRPRFPLTVNPTVGVGPVRWRFALTRGWPRMSVRPRARLLLAVFPILLSACTSWRVEYFEDTIQHAIQDEIIQAFGYPQRMRRLENGDTAWEYDFIGRGSHCARYLVIFDEEKRLRSWERRGCR